MVVVLYFGYFFVFVLGFLHRGACWLRGSQSVHLLAVDLGNALEENIGDEVVAGDAGNAVSLNSELSGRAIGSSAAKGVGLIGLVHLLNSRHLGSNNNLDGS